MVSGALGLPQLSRGLGLRGAGAGRGRMGVSGGGGQVGGRWGLPGAVHCRVFGAGSGFRVEWRAAGEGWSQFFGPFLSVLAKFLF